MPLNMATQVRHHITCSRYGSPRGRPGSQAWLDREAVARGVIELPTSCAAADSVEVAPYGMATQSISRQNVSASGRSRECRLVSDATIRLHSIGLQVLPRCRRDLIGQSQERPSLPGPSIRQSPKDPKR
jgi:hypothetical protein